MAQILRDVPWLNPHLGEYGNPALLEGFALQHEEMPGLPVAGARPSSLASQDGPFQGALNAVDIVRPRGSSQQGRGFQALRGMYWAASLASPSKHATNTLAAAIRGALRRKTKTYHGLSKVLLALEQATSLTEALEATAGLAKLDHRGLQYVSAWLERTLRQTRGGKTPPTPAEDHPPLDPSAERPRKDVRTRRRRPRDLAKEHAEAADPASVQNLVRRRPFPDQLENEPPGEFSGPDCVVSIDHSPGQSGKQALFLAHRAIWSGNIHLLPEHGDALLPDVHAAAVEWLVRRLERTDLTAHESTGLLGCLLKALSGRTTDGLKAIRVDANGDRVAIDEGVLDLAKGVLWIPVFWKHAPEVVCDQSDDARARIILGHFRPTARQSGFLSPTFDRVALPMPGRVRRVFRTHQGPLDALRDTPEQDLERAMSSALLALRSELQMPITMGGLRRSLGPLVMESSGDLALAQLICGESFGRTTAIQNYYAPRLKDVAAAYVAAMPECLKSGAVPRIPQPARRLGCELLVSAAAARSLAYASADPGDLALHDMGLAPEVTSHRAIRDHLARMILATSGHRPSEALFELTLADIDLVTGAALFRDKRHDVAHDPRLACLPSVAVKQLHAYIRHLECLATALPSVSDVVASVLAGDAPFLFDLDESGSVVPGRQQQLVARSTGPWNVLPWNWSRTYIRTRGIEMGAPAFLMSAQLGHFDAIGYPYSNQSPTDPADVIARTQPWLDRIAATQGWRVLESSLPSRAAVRSLMPALTGPLRNWRNRLVEAEDRGRHAQREWEGRLRADRTRTRDLALEWVLTHRLSTESGLSELHQDSSRPVAVAWVAELDVDGMRDAFLLEGGDDAIAAVARIRAFKRILHGLARRAGTPPPSMTIPIAVRRPLDNAFFQGACRAYSQVHALREHVGARAAERAPKRTLLLQVARTAEALALFGGIDDADTLLAILSARAQAQPSAKLEDLLLVPVDGRGPVALRGVAALALASLAQGWPDAPLPPQDRIEKALAGLLPAWALGEKEAPRDLLARLCSTVAVANRFELSPAARYAMDPLRGAVQATIPEQLAFIDADPVGPVRSVPDQEPLPAERGISDSAATQDAGTVRPYTQYRRLSGLIPQKGRSLHLPLTRREIPATDIALDRTRRSVLAELDAWLAGSQRPTSAIVRMLAEWTRRDLEKISDHGKFLANETVSTYLTRIGGALVRTLGTLPQEQWDEQVLEEAYAFALFASNDARHKVAARILDFHRFCEARYDLPDVDLGEVYAALRAEGRNVDAAMILPVERNAALAEIQRQAWDASNAGGARLARMADALTAIFADAGARLSEPLGLRVADVGQRPSGGYWARIRSNRMRRVKSRAGNRIVCLPVAPSGRHDRTWQWREDVRSRRGVRRGAAAYLMAELGNSRAFGEYGAVARMIRQALARATGRPTERLHRLRHLWAQERVTALALSAGDAHAVGAQPCIVDRGLEPRDLARISVPLGHGHWMTTLQCYVHIPFVLMSRGAARQAKDYFKRTTIAGALGYTPFHLDGLRRGKAGTATSVWFDHFRPCRVAPTDLCAPPPEALRDSPRWSASAVGRLLSETARCHSLDAALRLMGAPLEDASRVDAIATRWERKLGRRLLAGNARPGPKREFRRLACQAEVEKLWALYDSGDEDRARIRAVVDAFYTHLLPETLGAATLPEREARLLHDLLRHIGIAAARISIDPGNGGLCEFRLQRPPSDKNDGKAMYSDLRRVLAVIGLAAELEGMR